MCSNDKFESWLQLWARIKYHKYDSVWSWYPKKFGYDILKSIDRETNLVITRTEKVIDEYALFYD